jgi:hypothetical protein
VPVRLDQVFGPLRLDDHLEDERGELGVELLEQLDGARRDARDVAAPGVSEFVKKSRRTLPSALGR